MALAKVTNPNATTLVVGNVTIPGGQSVSVDILTPEMVSAARKNLVTVTAPNGGALVKFGLSNLVSTAISSYAGSYTALVDAGSVAANRNDAILAQRVAILENTVSAMLQQTSGRTGLAPPTVPLN